MLEFDEVTHTYTLDGARIPSVTQILREWIELSHGFVNRRTGAFVSREIFLTAQDFGEAIHKAGYLILTGKGVDYGQLAPELLPALTSLNDWIEESGLQVELCEQPMASQRYRYAGRPDIIGKIRAYREKCLIDLKSGNHEMAGAQTSAYEWLYRENQGYRGKLLRFALNIPKDGGMCQLIACKGQDDWPYFLSKLSCWNYEHKKGE